MGVLGVSRGLYNMLFCCLYPKKSFFSVALTRNAAGKQEISQDFSIEIF
jgi:hypothetical protein